MGATDILVDGNLVHIDDVGVWFSYKYMLSSIIIDFEIYPNCDSK